MLGRVFVGTEEHADPEVISFTSLTGGLRIGHSWLQLRNAALLAPINGTSMATQPSNAYWMVSENHGGAPASVR
jgi:hypothetical protein